MSLQQRNISWRLAFIIATCVLIVFHPKVFAGRGEADEQHKQDPCRHTRKGPNTEYKLISVTLGSNTEMCCGANPGYKITKLCKTFKPATIKYARCEPGTYIDEYAHNRTSCLKQIERCPFLDQILIEGNESIASRCDCQDGYHIISEGRCELHSACVPGEGVDCLGSPDHDTICRKCRHGYYSPSHSATERCTRIGKQISQTTATPTTVVSNDRATDTAPITPTPLNQPLSSQVCSEYTSFLNWIFVIVFYNALLVTGLSIQCCYNCRKKVDPGRRESEENRSLHR